MEAMPMFGFLFWLILAVVSAFDVIGIVEGVKSFLEAKQRKDKSVWMPVVSFALSFVVAAAIAFVPQAAIFGGTVAAVLFGGVTIFSFIELFGYNVVMKWVFAVVDAGVFLFRAKVCGSTGDGDASAS